MESLYLLIPLSIVVLAASLVGFFWAVKSGQYDDLDGDGERILFDEDEDEIDVDRSTDTRVASDKSVMGATQCDNNPGVKRSVATDG